VKKNVTGKSVFNTDILPKHRITKGREYHHLSPATVHILIFNYNVCCE